MNSIVFPLVLFELAPMALKSAKSSLTEGQGY
jgi:hypothetical protein